MAGWTAHNLLLAGIFVLLLLSILCLAREIIIPIVLAIFLNLLLQPGLRILTRYSIPKSIAALLMIGLFCGIFFAFGYAVSGPASDWLARASEGLPKLEHELSILEKPILKLQDTGREIARLADGSGHDVRAIELQGPSLGGILFDSTRTMIAGLGTVLILLFFLLVSGELFLRRLVEIVPSLSDKKQVVAMSYEIEHSISGYLGTITLINAGVGIITGVATYFCGLPDPALWGTLAFFLNYILIVGPLTNLAILALAGFLNFDISWHALAPAGAYLAIHLVEGETFTPRLMARRLTLNPVLIVVSLVFWFWMWGIIGALLAVPFLAVFKIVCEGIRPLAPLGHFLGAEAPE